MNDPTQLVAYHEAGHIVAAHALGLRIWRAGLWVDRQGELRGRTFAAYLPRFLAQFRGRRVLLAFYWRGAVVAEAGAAGEYLLTGDEIRLLRGDNGDRQQAAALTARAEQLDPRSAFGFGPAAANAAQTIVQEYKPAVAEVAKAISHPHPRRLWGWQLNRIIRRACPAVPSFDRWGRQS
jgi:hypothetical protein